MTRPAPRGASGSTRRSGRSRTIARALAVSTIAAGVATGASWRAQAPAARSITPAHRPPPPRAAVVLGTRVPPRVLGRGLGRAHARALAPLPLGLGETQPAEALSRRTVGRALPLHGRAGREARRRHLPGARGRGLGPHRRG